MIKTLILSGALHPTLGSHHSHGKISVFIIYSLIDPTVNFQHGSRAVLLHEGCSQVPLSGAVSPNSISGRRNSPKCQFPTISTLFIKTPKTRRN
jgi:hypothetical protein